MKNSMRNIFMFSKAGSGSRACASARCARAAAGRSSSSARDRQIGRAHVRTPVTNAHLVCRLPLEKKKHKLEHYNYLPLRTQKLQAHVQTTINISLHKHTTTK